MSQSNFSLEGLKETMPMGLSNRAADMPGGTSNRLMLTFKKNVSVLNASGMVEVLTSTLRWLRSSSVKTST